MLFLLAAAISQATPSTPARPILWRDLRAGMPKKEVKRLYPDFKSEVSSQCGVRVLSTYKDGGLRGVILVNRGKPNGCADKLLEEYTRANGSPENGEHSQYAMLPPHSVSADTYHWVIRGVDITLIRFRQSADWYNLIFREADVLPR